MTGPDPNNFQKQFARYNRATYLALGVVLIITWIFWIIPALSHSKDLIVYNIACSSITVIAIIKTLLVIRKNNRILKVSNIVWGSPVSISEKLPMGTVYLRVRYHINREPYITSILISLEDAQSYGPATLIPILIDPLDPTHAQPFLDKVLNAKPSSKKSSNADVPIVNSLTPLLYGFLGVCFSWLVAFGLYLAYNGPASFAKFFPIGKYGSCLSLAAAVIHFFVRKFCSRSSPASQSKITIPVQPAAPGNMSALELIHSTVAIVALVIGFIPNPPIEYKSTPSLSKEIIQKIPGNPSTQPDFRKFTLGVWKSDPQTNNQVQTLEFVPEGHVEISIRPSANAKPSTTQTGTWTFKDNSVFIVLIPTDSRPPNKPGSSLMKLNLSEDETLLTQSPSGIVFRRSFE